MERMTAVCVGPYCWVESTQALAEKDDHECRLDACSEG